MSDESLKDKVIIKFAQKLASNESKVRNRSVKKLRTWLSSKSQVDRDFGEKELLKLWKGLHYCMWMCDKPLVQQELSGSLSKLLHVFGDVDIALKFFSAFLKTQVREWFTTDRLRLDKFMMLIRMYFHEVFVVLQNHEWQLTHIRQLNRILSTDLLPKQSDQVPDGLKFHIISLYLEELGKVGAKELVGSVLLEILQPFIDVILVTSSTSLQSYIVKNIFEKILRQAKLRHLKAKERADLSDEAMETEDDETDNKLLQFDSEAIGNRLFELGSQKNCSGKNRATVYNLVKRFQQVSEGVVGESVSDDMDLADSEIPRNEESKALDKLLKFEESYLNKERNRKAEKKKRKKQKVKGTDSDQEEPATKRQKLETQPSKKPKNKFKDGDAIGKKGQTSKSKGKTEDDSSSHHQNSQPETEECLFQGGFMSDEEVENDDDDDDIIIDTSLQNDQCAPSTTKTLSQKKQAKTKSSERKNRKSERTLQSSSDMAAIFEGGFISSDEEDPDISVTSKVQRKKKNTKSEKNKNSDMDRNGSLEFGDENLQEIDELQGSTLEVSSGKKKKKRKSAEGKMDVMGTGNQGHNFLIEKKSKNHLNGSITAESKDGKKSKKKSQQKKSKGEEDNDIMANDSLKDCGSDDEVEIYIPNKKYQGKYKEWSLQQAELTTGVTTASSPQARSAEKKKKKAANKVSTPKTDTKFAVFDKLLQTPPAFVKKSVLKSSTPKTDPRHNKKTKGENAVLEGKRRVSFGLHKNEAQSTKDEASFSTLFLSDDDYEQIDDIELWTGPVFSPKTKESLVQSSTGSESSDIELESSQMENSTMASEKNGMKESEYIFEKNGSHSKRTASLRNVAREEVIAVDTDSDEDNDTHRPKSSKAEVSTRISCKKRSKESRCKKSSESKTKKRQPKRSSDVTNDASCSFGTESNSVDDEQILSSRQTNGKNDERIVSKSGSKRNKGKEQQSSKSADQEEMITVEEGTGNRNTGKRKGSSFRLERGSLTRLGSDCNQRNETPKLRSTSSVVVVEDEDTLSDSEAKAVKDRKQMPEGEKNPMLKSSASVVIVGEDDVGLTYPVSEQLKKMNTIHKDDLISKKKPILKSCSSVVIVEDTVNLKNNGIASDLDRPKQLRSLNKSQVHKVVSCKNKPTLRCSSSVVVVEDTDNMNSTGSGVTTSSDRPKRLKSLTKSQDSDVSRSKKKPVLPSSSSVILIEEADDVSDMDVKAVANTKGEIHSSTICDTVVSDLSSRPEVTNKKSSRRNSARSEEKDGVVCESSKLPEVSLHRLPVQVKDKNKIESTYEFTDDFLCEDDDDFLDLRKLKKENVSRDGLRGVNKSVRGRDANHVTIDESCDQKIARNSGQLKLRVNSKKDSCKKHSNCDLVIDVADQNISRRTRSSGVIKSSKVDKISERKDKKSLSLPEDKNALSSDKVLKDNKEQIKDDLLLSLTCGKPKQKDVKDSELNLSAEFEKPIFSSLKIDKSSSATDNIAHRGTRHSNTPLLKNLSVKPAMSNVEQSCIKSGVRNVQKVGRTTRTANHNHMDDTKTTSTCNTTDDSTNESQDDTGPHGRRRSKRLQNKRFSEDSDNDDCVILDVSIGSSPQVKYVRTHRLTQPDYDVIQQGEWLNDVHINLAHALLKKQFPSWQGFENCCLGNKRQQAFTPVSGRFVQLYNAHGNHWVTITNASCNKKNEVIIYDSYYRTVHSDTKKVILNLLDDYVDKSSCKVIAVVLAEFQKQRAQCDCGLFAIASVTSLVHGEDPSKVVYKQSAMRPHLERCFHKQHLTLFPTVPRTGKKLEAKICSIKLR